MDSTTNLTLPYIMPSQAQKHVTHNEALRILDAIVQLAIIDRDRVTAPAAPAEGDRYIVASDATGTWEGQDSRIAAWQDGAWNLFAPQPGWLAFIRSEGTFVFWNGTAWEGMTATASEHQNLALLGVGTAADATNPFSARLNKALWAARTAGEGGNGDLRYTMNKEGVGNVLSLLLQSSWQGRAEIGLVGNDDLSIKVSADGDAWKEALRIDRLSGRITAPNMLTDFAVSLYADSGRFAGPSANATTIGSFVAPAYFGLHNGASISGIGKYVSNNDDYGGSAGPLNAHVRELIDRIRDAAYRRYGLEFHVAQITAGSGMTVSPIMIGSTPHYLMYLPTPGPRVPSMTFHAYVRALDAPVGIRRYAGQTMFKNGVAVDGDIVVAPSDQWVSVTIFDEQNPRTSLGYQPLPFNLHMASTGHRALFACPALIGGITQINDDVGLIASVNRWLT